MKTKLLKIKTTESNYSIIIGNKTLNSLSKKIKLLCPKTKKIAVIIDKKVPIKFKNKIKKLLKNYQVYIFECKSSEKIKSFLYANKLVEKILSKNFNRSDTLIAVGGGVVGDLSAFIASIVKRGINFINIPTTLLAQVDSSIGGKTGVNSIHGKNLIGSFYQPKLVLIDVSFLNSLPRREMVCGFAEVLKHSLILNTNLFKLLEEKSNKILDNRELNLISLIIYKSCKVKLFFVKKDFKEKNLRMILNFGHTFAHAIEAESRFSGKINHGEAVLMGMMLAIKLSVTKKICSNQTLVKVSKIYKKNNLLSKFNSYLKKKNFKKLVYYMTNDKKNNDKQINLILLRKIGKTTMPGKFKFSSIQLKKYLPNLFNFNFQ